MRRYYPWSFSGEDLMTRDWSNLIVPSHSDDEGNDAAIIVKAAELVLSHRVTVFPGALDGRLADSYCNRMLGTEPRPQR